jgi:hypothetical protein
MFTCPSTGLEFASGIYTDEHSLAKVGHMPVTLRCPACGKTHHVTAQNAGCEETARVPPAHPRVATYGPRSPRS